jgi:hypothetical protein
MTITIEPPTMSEPLSKELATFERLRGELLSAPGKFAVIHGDELAGVFETYADALQAGYQKFGLSSFLVKQILQHERILFFTKDIGDCRTSP